MESNKQAVTKTEPHFDPLLECLVSITKIMNKPFSATTLTAGLPLVKNKLTPELFVRAAERGDIEAKIASFPLAKLTHETMPAVLLMKNNKAYVLTDIKNDGNAKIIRPEDNNEPEDVQIRELKDEYTGEAIFVQPAYRFDTRAEEIEKTPVRNWFWSVVSRAWPMYSEVLAASFLINLFAVAIPLFIMNVYDRVVPNNAMETLWVLSVGMFIVIGFDFLMRSLRGYFIDKAGQRIDNKLSASTFEQVLGLQMAERPGSVGSLANTMQAFESFRDFITSASISLLVDLPFVILFMLVILFISPVIVIVPLIGVPLILLVSLFMQVPLEKKVQESYRHAAEKQAVLIESLAGAEIIKTLGAEGLRQKQWETITNASTKLGVKTRLLVNFGINFAVAVQYLSLVLVIIVGVGAIQAGTLTIGGLIACTILTGRALAPVVQVAGILVRYKQSKASLTALDKIMQSNVDRPRGKSFLQRESIKGDIEFKDVSFAYPGQPNPALNNINFKIEAGEHVGIIGRAGSGKSSIAKLILDLYQPTAGSILIDGLDIKQLDPAQLRLHIGYIPQQVVLFHGSIRDNIVMQAPYIEDDHLLNAAKLSGVEAFINMHPDGFDRQVGERGSLLSGGQQQAVAIARAFLLEPSIYIFDEPTNSLDNTSIKNFIKHIKELYKDKTLILITHKASMLSLVDKIMVMEAGKVIASGPKEKILNMIGKKTDEPQQQTKRKK